MNKCGHPLKVFISSDLILFRMDLVDHFLMNNNFLKNSLVNVTSTTFIFLIIEKV